MNTHIECQFCRGSGEIHDPLLYAPEQCSACGGSGKVAASQPPNPPAATEALYKAKAEFFLSVGLGNGGRLFDAVLEAHRAEVLAEMVPPPATERTLAEFREWLGLELDTLRDCNKFQSYSDEEFGWLKAHLIRNAEFARVVPPPASADARGMVDALIDRCREVERENETLWGKRLESPPPDRKAWDNADQRRTAARSALLSFIAASEAAREEAEFAAQKRAEARIDRAMEANEELIASWRTQNEELRAQITDERQRADDLQKRVTELERLEASRV